VARLGMARLGAAGPGMARRGEGTLLIYGEA